MSGTFITFEGGEGAGKSTQIKRLAARLEEMGHDVLLTREPGGSVGAEVVRHCLLGGAAQPFGPHLEIMLFAAARLDHMREKIKPALMRSAVVLCDRFYDSTRAYQGSDEGVLDADLKKFEIIAVDGCHPDLTIILDIDPKVGLMRVQNRLSNGGAGQPATIDRFEQDDLQTHQKRRDTFLKIAQQEPLRCAVVDAEQDSDKVSEVIWALVQQKLKSTPNKQKLMPGDQGQ